VFFSLKKLFKEFKEKGKINLLIFFVLASVISYHISLFFSFSIIETNVFFWLFIGIVVTLLNDFKQAEIISFFDFKKFYYLLFFFLAIILSGFLVYSMVFNINALRADYFFKKARTGYYAEKYLDMFNGYTTTLKLNSKEEYYQWFYVNDLVESLEKVNSDKYRESVLNHIEGANFEGSLKNNFSSLFVKVKLYSALGKYRDKKYFSLAERAFNELIKISPYFPDLYNLGGRMYFMEGDYNKAIEMYEQALAVSSLNDHELYYQKYWQHRDQVIGYAMNIYDNILESYEKLGDYNMQIKFYNNILSLNPYRLGVYKKMANIYYKKGDFDKAILYNNRGYRLNSNDYSWPFSIALLYKEKGNKKESLYYAKKALDIKGDDIDIKNLIKEITK